MIKLGNGEIIVIGTMSSSGVELIQYNRYIITKEHINIF